MRKALQKAIPALIPFLIVTLAMEWLVRAGWIRAFLVRPPSAIFQTIVRDRAELFAALAKTSFGALTGFALSALGGVAIAIFLSSSRAVQQAFYPYAVFFQTVPVIAIAPLLVIWFGYGMRTVVASAFIVSIFPVIANTLNGILSTDPALRDLFRLYGASSSATLWKLRFPAALPQILTGLRIAGGLAVIGAIVGEFIGGQGLGSVVDVARTQQRTDKVFAAVLLASMLGLALFGFVNALSHVALRRWHASEQN
jgi:NitT/TauT family transport system permease protein